MSNSEKASAAAYKAAQTKGPAKRRAAAYKAHVTKERMREVFERLMAEKGFPVTKIRGGQKIIYTAALGTVRVRTNSEPVYMPPAHDDFEEDYQGVVTVLDGRLHAFLVPSGIAAKEVRETQDRWIAADPATRNDNRTPVMRFLGEDDGLGHGFAKRWARHHIGEAPLIDEADGLAGAAETFRQRVRAQHPSAVVHIAVDPTGNGGKLLHL